MAKNINLDQDFEEFFKTNFDTSKRPFKQMAEYSKYILGGTKGSMGNFFGLNPHSLLRAQDFNIGGYVILCEAFKKLGFEPKNHTSLAYYDTAVAKLERRKTRTPLKKYTFDRRKNKLKSLVIDLKEKGKGFVKDPKEFERLLGEISKQI